MPRNNIMQLITLRERRLQKLLELQASRGLDTPPHILTEIEDIKAAIEELQTELNTLEEEPLRTSSELTDDIQPKQRVQIYLSGDFSLLSSDRRSAALEAFAAVMGITPQAIELYTVSPGSIVFELGVPPYAARRLRSRLQSNSVNLRLLDVEKVIFQEESGRVEEWVIQEGKFDLATFTYPTISSDVHGKSQRAKKSYQADLFVGREGILEELVVWVCAESVNENEYIKLISAPAGYGKTWLLSELKNRLTPEEYPALYVVLIVAKDLDTRDKIETWLESVLKKANISSAKNGISERITQLVDELPQRVIFILDGLDELSDNEQSFIQKQLLEPFRHTYSARMVISCRDSFSLNRPTLKRAANAGLVSLSGLSAIEGQVQIEKLVAHQTQALLISYNKLIETISPLVSPYKFNVPEINTILFERALQNHKHDLSPLVSSDDLRFCWQVIMNQEEQITQSIEKDLRQIVIQAKRTWTLGKFAQICNYSSREAGKQIEKLMALSIVSFLEEEQCYQVNPGFREIILAQNGIHKDPDPEPKLISDTRGRAPKSIFVSYSHKDTDLKDQLLRQLEVLQLEGLLRVWSDDDIKPGEDWYPEIEKSLNEVSAAILLISADFLTSEFIRKEEIPVLLKRRKKDGLRLYIIIARPCPWKKIEWLSSIQASSHTASKPLSKMTEAEREEILAIIVSEIADLLNASSSP